ncbi:MAG: hypothetical protein OXD36_03905 [Rhodobacter sp.]|nr:hypothetical protein [Rhodobacter sp.]
MAEPDQHQKRTSGEFLWEVFDLQLRKTQRHLPWKMRFAIALSGSLALFSVLFSGRLLVGPNRNTDWRYPYSRISDPACG